MFKRTVAIVAATACLGLLVAPEAQAAPPSGLQSYAAGSSASSLGITLLGQDAALSVTTAAVSSAPQPTAAADSAALLLAGNALPGNAPAKAPGGAAHGSDCVLPADLATLTGGLASGVTIDIACTTNDAAVTSGAPDATSQSGTITITIKGLGGPILDPILSAILTPLLDTGSQVTDPICTTLPAVCDLVNSTLQVDIPAVIDEIFADLGQLNNGAFTLAQVFVSPSFSHDGASAADGVVAEAGSTGANVKLFPGLVSTIEQVTGLDLDPGADDALLTVSLGNAIAKVVRDPKTGAATTSGSHAQLLSAHLTDSLGILSSLVGDTLPDTLDTLTQAGAALSCTNGALKDVLCVDLGAVNELTEAQLKAQGLWYGTGTKGIEATAAGIAVLPILASVLPLDGDVLSVSLSQASASANATPVQEPTTTTAPPETPQDQPLPHTGGSNAFPLAMLLFGAATASAILVRRTRTV